MNLEVETIPNPFVTDEAPVRKLGLRHMAASAWAKEERRQAALAEKARRAEEDDERYQNQQDGEKLVELIDRILGVQVGAPPSGEIVIDGIKLRLIKGHYGATNLGVIHPCPRCGGNLDEEEGWDFVGSLEKLGEAIAKRDPKRYCWDCRKEIDEWNDHLDKANEVIANIPDEVVMKAPTTLERLGAALVNYLREEGAL